MMEQTAFFPEEGKKLINDWIKTYKKGREEFKAAADENFKKVETFFAAKVRIIIDKKAAAINRGGFFDFSNIGCLHRQISCFRCFGRADESLACKHNHAVLIAAGGF